PRARRGRRDAPRPALAADRRALARRARARALGGGDRRVPRGMTPDEARAKLAGARVARLATADADGRPHVVPITFALLGDDAIVSAVDHKPKRTRALKRL